MNKKKVAVVGLGYVGLPLAILARNNGHEVIGIDTDLKKINLIKNGLSPITNEEVTEELRLSPLNVSDQYSEVKDRQVIVICVPTPLMKDESPDYSFLISACKSLGKFLNKGQLIIVESTINPGTTQEILIPVLEKISNLKAGEDFYIAHVPERLNPGDTKWQIKNIQRVAGAINQVSLEKTIDFYQSIIDAKINPMSSIKEAEAVKIVENCFRDINIAFVNELAMSFSKLGINLQNVIEGASTKPFGFMPHYPGCGVGGHCIPVDPYYLTNYAKKNGFNHKLLLTARKINKSMPSFTVKQLLSLAKRAKLSKQKLSVCILGITYKANIADTRESPSLDIFNLLNRLNIKTTTHDPFLSEKSLDESLKGINAVIIATAHKEYLSLLPDYFINKGIRIIVDGRNCLNYEKFKNSQLLYSGIGC